MIDQNPTILLYWSHDTQEHNTTQCCFSLGVPFNLWRKKTWHETLNWLGKNRSNKTTKQAFECRCRRKFDSCTHLLFCSQPVCVFDCFETHRPQTIATFNDVKHKHWRQTWLQRWVFHYLMGSNCWPFALPKNYKYNLPTKHPNTSDVFGWTEQIRPA